MHHLSRCFTCPHQELLPTKPHCFPAGHEGAADAQQVCAATATALGVPAEHVLLQSAGALGQRLPLDRLLPALPVLASQLGASAEHAFHAAVAMTDRDSTTKEAALEVRC